MNLYTEFLSHLQMFFGKKKQSEGLTPDELAAIERYEIEQRNHKKAA